MTVPSKTYRIPPVIAILLISGTLFLMCVAIGASLTVTHAKKQQITTSCTIAAANGSQPTKPGLLIWWKHAQANERCER
jgi:hypothetical protein